METEVGKIATMVSEAEEEATPLEERLDGLARRLIWAVFAVAAVIAAAGILNGKETVLMVETAIALAVAAIPEGLPIVATIALARGMWRMARRNALINRLSAVETLGATTVICTDKTGTLTENRLTVTKIVLDSGEISLEGGGARDRLDADANALLGELLLASVLCNNASLPRNGGDAGTEDAVGDPLEIALLTAAAKAGMHREDYFDRMPETREEAFDSDTKLMATFNRDGGDFRVSVKGAPEVVIARCSGIATGQIPRLMTERDREHWLGENERLAAAGLRVIAFATKTVDDESAEAYTRLNFLGLVGMADPPRADVRHAIESCRAAGIRVIMVTGDQAVTARTIGRAVGLVESDGAAVVNGADLGSPESLGATEREHRAAASLFARVSPEQKLDLIALHQDAGEVVAMTGDGVNDAPALKKADIGIAMGMRGTQVAREAAPMVLKDDAFATIVAAIEQGRIIFENIRKAILYLLSCNVSEVMIVALAAAVNAPLPILPLQILFLNLVTDVFPALALSVGEGEPGIMRRPPRDPHEPVLTRRHWGAIAVYGFTMTVAVLGSFAVALTVLDMELRRGVTVSFLTLAFTQLWHVFNMRSRGSHIMRNSVMRNGFVWGALVFCAGLLFAAVYVPVLSTVLKLAAPGPSGWALVFGMSLVPLIAGQLSKLGGGTDAHR
jgi:Ca2+-transporting ATPase